ncbi:hypothetical protein WBK31_35135 [Nonomuraea sp. N2-4H]|uniref:hypothetical protein n=1 Tax=Nonomuraea sp. N2-4H TaxID=3128898 RepID=UPI0032550A46
MDARAAPDPGELAALEARLRVELPGEYRFFLLQVGRGAAGIFPVRHVDGQWRWEGDGAGLTNLDTLEQPVPYIDAYDPAGGLPPEPDKEDYASIEEYNAADEA